jgi:hypothetical protein
VKFFAMRYRPGVKLEARKHQVVDRRFESWADAEDARLATDVPDLLDVVEREVPAVPVMQS